MNLLAIYLRTAAGVLGIVLSVFSVVLAETKPGVRLLLYDGVRLPGEILRELRDTVNGALAATDIALDWRTCGRPAAAGCPTSSSRSDVVVRIVETHPGMAPNHCGFAVVSPEGAGFVSLAVSCATRARDRMQRGERAGEITVRLGTLLGYILAHELAHVLLPGQPHSPSGIFSGRLNRAHLAGPKAAQLTFLPEDIQRLRDAAR